MTQITQSRSELSTPTKISSRNSGEQYTIDTSSGDGVIRLELRETAPPKGYLSVADLIRKIEADDPKARSEHEAARRWARDALYQGEEGTIRALRLSKGWSQARLAEEMETQQSYVARIERGRVDLLLDTCRKLADALDVDLNTIGSAIFKQRQMARRANNDE